MYAFDSQMPSEDLMHIDNVPYRYLRKGFQPWHTGFRIQVCRTGGPITGTKNVCANHIILRNVKQKSFTRHSRPPRFHIRVRGKGMTDPDNIISLPIQRTIGIVGYLQACKHLS